MKTVKIAIAIASCWPSAVWAADGQTWERMAPCRQGGHVYVAAQFSPENDPKADLHLSAVAVTARNMGMVVAADATEDVKVQFDALELVDARTFASGQWALIRTAHPRVLEAKVPECRLSLAPEPPAAGCPAWAYPHTTVDGDLITVVGGWPLRAGQDVETVEATLLRRLNTLVMFSGNSNAWIPHGTREPRGGSGGLAVPNQEAMKVERLECGGALWIRGRVDRKPAG